MSFPQTSEQTKSTSNFNNAKQESDRIQHGNSKSVLNDLENNQLHKKPQDMKGITSKARGNEGRLTTHALFSSILNFYFLRSRSFALKTQARTKKQLYSTTRLLVSGRNPESSDCLLPFMEQ